MVGRKRNWRIVIAPPLMSPPTRFSFIDSSTAGDETFFARMQSRKPGAKRSICASMRAVMSTVELLGT